MSKKFNINDYPGKYVMHCKTEEEAKDFCRVLHEAGRCWKNLLGGNNGIYLGNTHWRSYAHDTCYVFNEGLFGGEKYLRDKQYTILEWSDFMNKEFTRDDIKVGDILMTRAGEVQLVIDTTHGIRVTDSNIVFNRCISSDLCHLYGDESYDIVAIRRFNNPSSISFDAFEKNLGRLVYEREETVEMTLEEVCKALGKNVKIVKE